MRVPLLFRMFVSKSRVAADMGEFDALVGCTRTPSRCVSYKMRVCRVSALKCAGT